MGTPTTGGLLSKWSADDSAYTKASTGMVGRSHDADNHGQSNGNGRIKLSFSQVVVIVSWIVTVLLAYGAIDSRLTVLEDRYERLFQDVSEIKRDVRTLVDRMR